MSRNIFEALKLTFSSVAGLNSVNDEGEIQSEDEYECPPPLRQRLGMVSDDDNCDGVEDIPRPCDDSNDAYDAPEQLLLFDDEGDMDAFFGGSDASDDSLDSDSVNDEDWSDSDLEDEVEICSGVEWYRQPTHNVRLRRNIVTERQRTLMKDTDEMAVFDNLFPEEIRRIILRCTNKKATAIRSSDSQKYRARQFENFSYHELNTFLGFIIRAGANRDNMTALCNFYKEMDSKPFYRTCMSFDRIKFLLRCLRFDNFWDREERKNSDKLAAIRDVWDMFIPLLRRFYIPGLELAVD